MVDVYVRWVYALDYAVLVGVDLLSGYPSDTCVYMCRRCNAAFVEFGQEFEVL